MEERVERSLREAAERIAPDGAAGERILEKARAGKRSRKRLSGRMQAAAFCICMLIFVLWFETSGFAGDEIVVYAATEDHGWQKLKEDDRILLGKEEYDPDKDYPYMCTFRLEVPEKYLYDRELVVIRDDIIVEEGDIIRWLVAEDRAEDAGRVMQGAFRLWIVDENGERIGAYELELTKEDGKCYAELKRVWEKQGK